MKNDYHKSKDISKQMIDLLRVDHPDTSHLEEWIVTNRYAKEVIEELTDAKKLSEAIRDFSRPELKHGSKVRLEKSIVRSKRIRMVKRTISTAAALVAVSFLIGNFTRNETIRPSAIVVEKVAEESFTEPTLVLSSGEKINLTTIQSISDAQIVITKNDDSSIAYVGDVAREESQMNMLIVPKERRYTVMLSDGTKVVVNANGKLTYPLVFTKGLRQVRLEGEAYFEVAKGDSPFIVETQGAHIKVYGTKFNINSYRMNSVRTMLFEGSVGVKSTLSNATQEYIMKKNQVSEIRPMSGKLTVEEFNPSEYKSWVDGYFYSDGETLEQFLLSLSKWYDVEFTYVDATIKESPLVGVFRSDLPIKDILSTIEKVLRIRFVKNERGYMVN